mgnify:CR=1 FL=1
MGSITILSGDNMTLSTGSVLAGFQTAAANAAAARVKVRRVEISENTATTIQMCRGAFSTRDTAGTLTMTSTTPLLAHPLPGPASGHSGNPNSLGAAGRSGTSSSADSGGTYTNHHTFNFANVNGYLWKPDDKEELWVPASTVWVVRFVSAPATLTGWSVSIVLEEE